MSEAIFIIILTRENVLARDKDTDSFSVSQNTNMVSDVEVNDKASVSRNWNIFIVDNLKTSFVKYLQAKSPRNWKMKTGYVSIKCIGSWSDSTVGKILALNRADLGLNFDMSYDPLIPPRVIVECGLKS